MCTVKVHVCEITTIFMHVQVKYSKPESNPLLEGLEHVFTGA